MPNIVVLSSNCPEVHSGVKSILESRLSKCPAPKYQPTFHEVYTSDTSNHCRWADVRSEVCVEPKNTVFTGVPQSPSGWCPEWPAVSFVRVVSTSLRSLCIHVAECMMCEVVSAWTHIRHFGLQWCAFRSMSGKGGTWHYHQAEGEDGHVFSVTTHITKHLYHSEVLGWHKHQAGGSW